MPDAMPAVDAIRAQLERDRAEFTDLVRRCTPADLARVSNGTRWTNRELVFHMLFGYLITRTLRLVIKIVGRVPVGVQRRFAALLDAGTRPFDRINYWGSVVGGRLLRPASMVAWMDRVITALCRHLDRDGAAALQVAMAFPTRWDPYFTDRMTLAGLYRYSTLHFDHHRRQLTLDERTDPPMPAGSVGGTALTPVQAARVYDRIGRVQDWQAAYEDRAVADLLAHADLAHAHAVLEFGCGTGRLAARILRDLPAGASYLGLDVSARMVMLATRRLRPWSARAQVQQVDGTLPLPIPDGAVDRVISTYVFDLLDEHYATAVLEEFRRVLTADGLLCLTSLATGQTRIERTISAIWTALWRHAPRLVGGCRPIHLDTVVDAAGWRTRHRRIAHAYGLVSDVITATKANGTDRG
jgi:SAM-dependent methyltransferase